MQASENRFGFTLKRLSGVTCPADKAKVRVQDTSVPGLTLLITANGARTFYLYKKINGRPLELKLGTDQELTIEQARKLAAQRIVEIAAGQDPEKNKREAREAATLGDMWETYRGEVLKGERTMIEDAGLWRRYLQPWATRRVKDLTVEAVQKLYNRISAGNMDREVEDTQGHMRPVKGGGTAANRTMALLSGMFSAVGRKFGVAGFNPCSEIRKGRETACERYLSAEEMPAFWKALDGQADTVADLFKLALFTAQRRWPLFAMRWDEINLPFKVWTIPADKMKSGKAHTVPLVAQAVEILERRREAAGEGAEWVFAAHSESGHVEEPKKAITAIVKASGLDPFTLHDLRRTAATWMNAMGASETIIAAVLAHKYKNVTGIYAKATEDAKRQALARAVDALTAAVPMQEQAKAG